MKADDLIMTHECFCGCSTFKILATFDDFEISSYSLEMYCLECSQKYATPTPLDRPE